MEPREGRRDAIVERLADHLLAEGLAGASLRPMAKAAGTSDRMLLYYFADKDELLAAALGRVAGRLAETLERAAPEPAEPATLLRTLWNVARSDEVAPHMRLWLELSAQAARGEEPHRAIAGAIADGFLAWVDARLAVEDPEERAAQAALLLATVDGLVQLRAVGRGDVAAAAVERGVGDRRS